MTDDQQLALVDVVWAAARDLRWHTLKETAKRTRASHGGIELVINFLEKYGFIQVPVSGQRMFRINPGAPSPTETAHSLRSLLRGPYPAE